MLEINTPAPDFSLPDQNGTMHTLSAYKGQWVLVYFYPKDDTSGCTTEACNFRDKYDSLKQKLVILGISSDNQMSHKKFAEKYQLPFSILADTEKIVIKNYQAEGLLAKRISYLINPQGIITKTYPKVDPAIHAQEILHDITIHNIAA